MDVAGNGSEKPVKSDFGKLALLVVAAFCISRSLYYIWGIHFEFSTVWSSMQVLDVNLLQHRLIESIWNLHSQPPLFNLFLGIVVKCFPNYPDIALRIIYLGCGLILGLSMLALALALGIPRLLAVSLTVAYVVSPTTVLYENDPFYTYPTACLLCVAALLLSQWERRGRMVFGIGFFVCSTGIIMTRSVFQLVWLGLAGLPLLLYKRIGWRSVLVAAAVPVLVVVAWQAKNFHQFGVVATSSWLGMNMNRNTLERLTADEKSELVQQGLVSDLAAIPVYSEFEAYERYVRNGPAPDIPVLMRTWKHPPSWGPNFNYVGYIDVSRQRLADAIHFIGARPVQFARNVLDAFAVYFKPSGNYFVGSRNWDNISILHSLYTFQGQGSILARSLRVLLACGYALAVCFGAYVLFLGPRRGGAGAQRNATIGFMWVTVVYVAIVTNLTDIWENHRMRFVTDPYVWIMLGMAANQSMQRVFRKLPQLTVPRSSEFTGGNLSRATTDQSVPHPDAPYGPSSRAARVKRTSNARLAVLIVIVAIFLVFFAFVIALYHQGFSAPFTYDTRSVMLGRADLFEDTNVVKVVGFFSNRPLLMLSLLLNHAVTGSEPFYYRLFSGSMLAAAGVALVFLIMIALETPGLRAQISRGEKVVISLLLAAVFVSHPLQSLVVLYIWQRSVLLACFFAFSALALYLAARCGRVRRPRLAYGATSVLFALGMLSKEIVVVLPALFVMAEFTLLCQSPRDVLRRMPALVLISLPPLIVYMLFAHCLRGTDYISLGGVAERISVYYETSGISPLTVFMTQTRVLVFYLLMILAPSVFGVPMVRAEVISRSIWSPPETLGAMVCCVVLVAAAGALVKKRPLVSFGILFYFISLIPESFLIPHYLFFGYRAIFPMAGVLLVAADLILALIERMGDHRFKRVRWPLLVGALLLCIVILGWNTYSQAKKWSPLQMWKTAYETLPVFSDRIETVSYLDILGGYGAELTRAGKTREAIKVLEKAVRVGITVGQSRLSQDRPTLREGVKRSTAGETEPATMLGNERQRTVTAYVFLGMAYQKSGNLPKAIESYRKAIRIDPNMTGACNNLAAVLEESGDLREALKYYIRAAQFEPPSKEACRNINRILEHELKQERGGNRSKALKEVLDTPGVRRELANALMNCGKLADAIVLYEGALRLDPNDSRARANMGLALLKSGRLEDAVVALEKAVEGMGPDATLHNALGVALVRTVRAARAIEQFTKALAVDPKHEGARRNLARAMSLKQ